MLEPGEFLAAARLLSGTIQSTSPSDAQFGRAISTAYYALFHAILGAAARRFMGPNQQAAAGYSLLYRSFDHQRMRQMCEELQRSTLRDKYKKSLGRSAASQDMQDFAEAFPKLQDARHLADYDPIVTFAASDVAFAITSAQLAIDAFNRAPSPEQADVLALLMVGARG